MTLKLNVQWAQVTLSIKIQCTNAINKLSSCESKIKIPLTHRACLNTKQQVHSAYTANVAHVSLSYGVWWNLRTLTIREWTTQISFNVFRSTFRCATFAITSAYGWILEASWIKKPQAPSHKPFNHCGALKKLFAKRKGPHILDFEVSSRTATGRNRSYRNQAC